MRHAASKYSTAARAEGSAARDASGCRHGPQSAAHAALFYSGNVDYLEGITAFLEAGIARQDAVAVAVPRARTALLRERLGSAAAAITFLDMEELGRNPARIIPAVLGMLEEHDGRMLHYVGEPVWPGRSAEEIREATRHEALINLAWPHAAIRVLCPYDVDGLAPEVLRNAETTHPWVMRGGSAARSSAFGGAGFPAGTDNPLPPPPLRATRLTFALRDLGAVRAVVSATGQAAGLGEDRVDDLVIAVNEVATNAIKYGDQGGTITVWTTARSVVCQLEDPGHITDPLAGRHAPVAGTNGGIGLWMVNQLCDLVEVRTTQAGTTIRLHAAL